MPLDPRDPAIGEANATRKYYNFALLHLLKIWRQTILHLIGIAIVFVPTFLGAQTTIQIPPEKFEMAPGGVDMRTGRYVYNKTDLSIGDPSQNGLTLTRTLPSIVPQHTANPIGNFTHNWDVSIEVRNVDLSGAPTNGNLPSGNDFEAFVNFNGRTQTFTSPYSAVGYGSLSKTAYFSLTFAGSRLGTNSVYTFADTSGNTVQFQWLGSVNGLTVSGLYATQISKADGTTYSYNYTAYSDGTGNHAVPQTIVSSFGYALLFEYSGGLITKACALNLSAAPLPPGKLCPTGAQTVSYSYAGSQLSSVTDPTLAASTFQYGSSGGITTMGFVKPGTSLPWLVNTTGVASDELGGLYDQVISQNFADGQSYSYTYVRVPLMNGRATTKMGGSFTNALSQKTTATYSFPALPRPTCSHPPCAPPTMGSTVYQITPGPTSIVDPLGNTTVNDYCDPTYGTSFCDVGLLQSTTSPEGVKSAPKFDSNSNIISMATSPKAGSGITPITLSATYSCVPNLKSCNKPTSTTDAKGNVTAFTYDPSHGGILTETDPADVNGVQSQKRYGYVQRYAWVSNGAGGYVHSVTPVWLLSTLKTCIATATVSGACSGGAADEVVTTYDYGPDSGPNNLLLRGTVVTAYVGGTINNRRTCFGFDPQGNKISETKPRAGLAVCS